MDDAVRDVELQVALLLRLADRNRRRSPLLDGTLDRSAYLALHLLEEQGPLGVNEIADHLSLDASTVTRQVLAMESAGFVGRGRDDNDRRRSVIAMTPSGAAALAATREARHRVYERILASWTEDDRRHLATLMGRMLDDIKTNLEHTAAQDAPPA